MTNYLKHLFFIFLLLFYSDFLKSQQAQPQIYKPIYDNLVPSAPTAFQFTKYMEMPVSQYTGIPNISLPVYTIKVDGVEFPIVISYHAGGIRVSQDASWVGLGWDLTLGSVIQTINDQDDFGSYLGNPNPKVLPDYFHNAIPGSYPIRWNYGQYCTVQSSHPSWVQSTPVNTPQANYGFMVATDYYAPVGGSVQRRVELFDYEEYDSEPDIFKANFLGHSISFTRVFTNNNTQYIVLNKKGYKIERTGDYDNDAWNVTAPDGVKYYFEERIVTKTSSETVDYYGNSGSPSKPSSKTWMLTKVRTINNKFINISYSRTPEKNQYPGFSQKKYKITSEQQNLFSPSDAYPVGKLTIGFNFFSIQNFGHSYSYTIESSLYPSLIEFEGGSIQFFTSTRQDVDGGIKLDQIKVKSNKAIVDFNFNYEYFDASSVNSAGFAISDNDFNRKRLKLSGITLLDGTAYTFQYNSTLLPKKNSFAQDYWGYYNGALSNQSLVPDAARLNRPDLFNSGDNHSASISHAKAAVLEKIVWPTGGSTQFVYELNEFGNYWVPDFATTSNTVSHGHGLRVKEVIYSSSSGVVSKKSRYSYEGGKAINPKEMIRTFPYSSVNFSSCGEVGTFRLLFGNYSLTEVNGNGFYSSNTFGSISGVGYDKVIVSDIGVNEELLGRTETFYHNYPDRVSSSSNSTLHINVSLPATKHYDPQKIQNGTVKEVKIYNGTGTLLTQEILSYSNIYSDIQYGARIYGYGMLVHPSCQTVCHGSSYWCGCGWSYVSKHLVGYYPIFDFESRLYQKVVKQYSNGIESVTSIHYGYDQYNQITTTDYVSNGTTVTNKTIFTPEATGVVRDYMVGANRFSDIWGIKSTIYPPNIYPGIVQSEYTSTYKIVNGNYVQDVVTISENGPIIGGNPKLIQYDLYDNDGNLVQYSSQGLSNSIIWDYGNQYPVAKVGNSSYSNIAYTSFEADGSGNWGFGHWKIRYDLSAVTGKKVYDLEGGMWHNTLDPSVTYKVSFWAKGSRPGININHPGGGFTILQNSNEVKLIRSLNGWNYYEAIVSNAANMGIWKHGHEPQTFIDEVRLHPVTAQMTTYTYEPLIGMTSQCDLNNRIQYYQYDAFNRLQYIRDENRNFLKMYCYTYNGQQEECNGTAVGNDAISQTFYRDCGPGFNPGPYVYTIPANMYFGSTKASANAKRDQELAANGQLFANTNANCTAQTIYAKLTYENWTYAYNSSYADVVVRFYSDEACTQPATVTNLPLQMIEDIDEWDYNNGSSSNSYNHSPTVSGNAYVFGYSVLMYQTHEFGEFMRWFSLAPAPGYTISY